MQVLALSLGYAYTPTLPDCYAAFVWIGLAFLVGGAWALFDRWARGKVDRLPWNTICYGWPTAMLLAWPVFVLGEPTFRETLWIDTVELLVVIYFLVNVPAMAASAVFVFSPLLAGLLMLLSLVANSEWPMMIVFGLAFWASWFAIVRHLEERWTCQILNLNLNPNQSWQSHS